MDDHGAGPDSSRRDPSQLGPHDPKLRSLYGPFIESLPISGVSISIFDLAGSQSTICASNRTAARLEELQFEFGTGPHWDALLTGHPVLVPDLLESAISPVYGETLLGLSVGAMFAFPMSLGAAIVGVVDLYRSIPGELDDTEVATAVRLTSTATPLALRYGLRSALDDSSREHPSAPGMRREVHQATGMILVQLDISATDAFSRLRAYAFGNSRTVQDVAHDVVTGKIDFSSMLD